MAIQCKACGANDAAVHTDGKITCKYCGGLIEAGWFDEWNPFARNTRVQIGINTKKFVVSGLALFSSLSLIAMFLDRPHWFSSDLAIALWSAVVPLCVLVWAWMLHPARRSPAVFVLVVLANWIPMLLGAATSDLKYLARDDFWGISGAFGGITLTAFILGAILNNLRKNSSHLLNWFLGK